MLSFKFKLFSGTLIYYEIGEVESGFLPGATFIEVDRSPNPDPDICFTDNGISKLLTDVAVITIQNGSDKITCWGNYIDKLEPGLNKN